MKGWTSFRELAAAAMILGVLGAHGCGSASTDDQVSEQQVNAALNPTTTTSPPVRESPEGHPRNRESRPARDERGSPDEASPEIMRSIAKRTYRTYIRAINARDGEAVCRIIQSDLIKEIEPPMTHGDCASRIEASFGYADPRGFPVWKATILSDFLEISVDTSAMTSRVTASIVTQFADREEVSVEDEVAYIKVRGHRGQLMKAPGSLWRAMGKRDVPPTVVAAP